MRLEKDMWRFGETIIDLNEVVAVVGDHVTLAGGKEIGIGDEAADALRAAIPPYPARPQDIRGKAEAGNPSSARRSSPPGNSQARVSKAQGRLRNRS